jgi:hypothetical protein
VTAAKDLPVYCVDSRNLSSGIALLACEAVDMIEAGCEDPRLVVERVTALIDKVDTSFILDRLDYMYKGGRCSMVAVLGANVLRLMNHDFKLHSHDCAEPSGKMKERAAIKQILVNAYACFRHF